MNKRRWGTGARMLDGNMLHFFWKQTKQEYHGAIREQHPHEGYGTLPIVSLAVPNPAELTLC
jgi:hypothetical protein